MGDKVELLDVEEKKLEGNKEIEDNKEIDNKIKKKVDFRKRLLIFLSIGIVVLLFFIGVILIRPVTKKIFKNIGKNEFSIVDVKKSSTGNYASVDEVFKITTTKGSLDEVKKHINVEPAINYDIEQISRNEFRLVTNDIPSDTLLNISYVDNSFVEDKWAFQSTKELKVNSVYPANDTSNISVNSAIEITFSYPDVSNVKDSIIIEPSVEGEFEHIGRTWILKPTKPLLENTVYTITINDTIKRGDEHLNSAYKSTFSTYVSNSSNTNKTINYSSITVDNIATFTPDETIYFRTNKDVRRVEILKLKDANEFRKYINNKDYSAESLGDVTFDMLSNNSYKLYRVNKKLEVGYYLEKGYLENGELIFTIPIQVNNLSAFLMTSNNDLLVWTGSNNKLLSDVNVKYEKKSVKTNKNGIGIIKNYNDLSHNIKYVELGDNNPVFVGIKNDDRVQYPNGYIYTDRPLYKNSDVIKIWGFIPLKYFENNADVNDFVLTIDKENIPIKINDDGTFITSYNLKNVKDGYKAINLSYKNKSVAYRSVEIKQYEKEMYDFIINTDRNYVKAGDKFHFDVTVKHISGSIVPNKELQLVVGNNTIGAVTNDDGVASFDIDTSLAPSAYELLTSKYVTIKGTLTESIQKGRSVSYYVINRYLKFKNSDYDKSNKEFSLDIYNIANKSNVVSIDWDYEQLLDTKYSGSARVELEEGVTTRNIDGYRFNDITKENIPNYTYNTTKSIVETKNVNVDSGKLKYKIDYKYKKSTDDINYYYTVHVYLKDKNGVDTEYSYPIGTGFVTDKYSNGYKVGYSDSYYDLYNYYLNSDNKNIKYSVGDSIERKLLHYSGNVGEVDNNFLFVKYKNSIIDNKIIDNSNSIKYNFDDSDRAGIKISGSYYKDGKFYRIPSEYLDYKEQDSKLDVSIKTEKKKYSPKSEVDTEITVLKNGKGRKSKLNISVVDEGVFNNVEDSTGILEKIYRNLYYSDYTFSTYRDYSLFLEGGGAGSSTSTPRADFGDTIYFEEVETDSNGKARIKFKLNDSITSFRITVHAVDDDVDVGVNHVNVESTLPVSISYTEPRGIKESDDVVLNALGIGSESSDIKYVFKIKEINKELVKNGKIGKNVYANFGKLKSGEYTVNVTATTKDYKDQVEYKIRVVSTQNEIFVKNTDNINNLRTIKPVKNPIKLEFYRNSFADYEKFLNIIKTTNENRMDIKFSYMKALEYENNFINEKNVVSIGNVSVYKGENGWKYLAGEDVSYELTALLSYYDDSLRFNKDIYYSMINNEDSGIRLDGYMVLASMKEPILDDLLAINPTDINETKKLMLSYLFLGDYKNAKKYYSKCKDLAVGVYASTFVDKKKASKMISKLYKKEPSNRYLYFSIISYFENNNVDLESVEEFDVVYGKNKKTISLKSLGKEYLDVYQDELKELKFNSKYDDIMVNYYYDGSISEISNDKKSFDIKLSSDKVKLGSNINLIINTSLFDNDNFKVYLPNGLKMSDTYSNEIAFIDHSKIEYITVYLSRKTNNIVIPLYASSPGEYKIEPVIVKKDDIYYISNDLTVRVEE